MNRDCIGTKQIEVITLAQLTPAPGSSASLAAPPRALNVLNGTSAQLTAPQLALHSQ